MARAGRKHRYEIMKTGLAGETFRYLVFGALTFVLNVLSYCLLEGRLGTLAANTTAFCLAVLFAYFTNSLFVFKCSLSWKSFFQFISMRIATIFIDNGGLLLLIHWGWNKLLVKCVVNIIIIGLNYLFSKLFIFRDGTPVSKN